MLEAKACALFSKLLLWLSSYTPSCVPNDYIISFFVLLFFWRGVSTNCNVLCSTTDSEVKSFWHWWNFFLGGPWGGERDSDSVGGTMLVMMRTVSGYAGGGWQEESAVTKNWLQSLGDHVVVRRQLTKCTLCGVRKCPNMQWLVGNNILSTLKEQA